MLKRHSLVDVLSSSVPLVTCDRISLVANFQNRLQVEKWLATELHCEPIGMVAWPYRLAWKTLFGMVIYFRDPAADSVPEIRIEFNPSKIYVDSRSHLRGICGLLFPLFSGLKDVRFTRLDIAVDYPIDLSTYQFTLKSGVVKTIKYYGRDGSLETVYLGGATSSRRFRIYNKALEAGLQGQILWRIEAQYRFDAESENDIWMRDLFGDLEISSYAPAEILPVSTLAVLYFLQNHPEAISSFAPASRAKYRKLMKLEKATIYHPEEAWSNQCGPVLNFLNWITVPVK